MSSTVDEIMTQALQLSSKERAIIAERLISSLESHVDLDVERAWQREVQRRVESIEEGAVQCIPWEEVRERLRNSAGAKD
jgi:putative addiction module component (TIGR02574 family)